LGNCGCMITRFPIAPYWMVFPWPSRNVM
jgi:hypothetical protein